MTVKTKITIAQGDNTPIRRVKFKDIDVSSCTMQQTVARAEGNTVYVNTPVTETVSIDGVEYFHVYLSPAQTAALAEGAYKWSYRISASGTTPPLSHEVQRDLVITKRYVAV